jgi:hypothetical protein
MRGRGGVPCSPTLPLHPQSARGTMKPCQASSKPTEACFSCPLSARQSRLCTTSRGTARRYKAVFPTACQLHLREHPGGDTHLAKHALNNQKTSRLQKCPALVDGGKEEFDLSTGNQRRDLGGNETPGGSRQIVLFSCVHPKPTCQASRSGYTFTLCAAWAAVTHKRCAMPN